MSTERWARVTELFGAALEHEGRHRHGFLGRACNGDDALRAEVESLIQEHEHAGDFLAGPPLIHLPSFLDGAAAESAGVSESDPYLGLTVSERYRMEARIGQGGQALVYRAADLMLRSRPVVVKVLANAGPSAALGRRFQEEVEALSRIDHPGVVGVLDAGSLQDGTPFLVMQYAEGLTLRQALANGPLAPARTATILAQIGAALEAAHSRGVVHGDVKPENIVLRQMSDGTELARLIDFGIAAVEHPDGSVPASTGVVAGSVRYMAPEQFAGERSRATDIYALGLLACEMLCGHPDPGVLRTSHRIRRRIRTALAVRPEDRPASAKTFCSQLAGALVRRRRITIALSAAPAAVVAFAVGALWVAGRADHAPEIRTMAVLPFEVSAPSADTEAMGLGMADALITRVSSISALIIRPISAVRRYDGIAVDPLRAARDLQVDAVVTGSVRWSDGNVRADVRVLGAAAGDVLWAGTIEAPRERLFALEEGAARQIASHVGPPLADLERRMLRTRPQLNPEAHQLYVKGRFEWGKRTGPGFENAADYFRRAIDLDPTYARAYAGLADCHLLLGGYGHHPQLEMLPKAKALALRALELDPSLGEAHATLGLTAQNLDWDWAEVEREYRQAVTLAPYYATGQHWYAEFLSILGRFEESGQAFAEARRIDPISPIIQIDEAQLYFFERQYGRSLETLRAVARTDPGFDLVYERIAFIHLVEGREEEAWRAIQRRADCRAPSSECRRVWTAYLPGRNRDESGRALAWMERAAATRQVPPFALVLAHIRHGQPDRALDWLEYMLENHDVPLITARVNPLFDPLHSSPRFVKILERLHLAD